MSFFKSAKGESDKHADQGENHNSNEYDRDHRA